MFSYSKRQCSLATDHLEHKSWLYWVNAIKENEHHGEMWGLSVGECYEIWVGLKNLSAYFGLDATRKWYEFCDYIAWSILYEKW